MNAYGSQYSNDDYISTMTRWGALVGLEKAGVGLLTPNNQGPAVSESFATSVCEALISENYPQINFWASVIPDVWGCLCEYLGKDCPPSPAPTPSPSPSPSRATTSAPSPSAGPTCQTLPGCGCAPACVSAGMGTCPKSCGSGSCVPGSDCACSEYCLAQGAGLCPQGCSAQ